MDPQFSCGAIALKLYSKLIYQLVSVNCCEDLAWMGTWLIPISPWQADRTRLVQQNMETQTRRDTQRYTVSCLTSVTGHLLAGLMTHFGFTLAMPLGRSACNTGCKWKQRHFVVTHQFQFGRQKSHPYQAQTLFSLPSSLQSALTGN